MQYIDGNLFKLMVISAANKLEKNRNLIDSLNVFPVPDGDTGTNMSLTMLSAAKELSVLENDDISEMSSMFSSAILRGARGNSGVILSQLVRGFAKAMKGKKQAYPQDLAEGLKLGVETAYKAVMKPKEGTILTVAKDIAESVKYIYADTEDVIELVKICLESGNKSLDRTPELLPVLKQAGVVDSGGKGLLCILEGAYEALTGDTQNIEVDILKSSEQSEGAVPQVNRENIDTADIKYGYCTEFLVLGESFSDEQVDKFRSIIEKLGDSAVVVGDVDIIKVHVHTNTPGSALNEAVKLGALSKIKIENMREQHTNLLISDAATKVTAPVAPAEKKEVAFIAVAVGDGFNMIFKDLGVDYIISGGQSMNPSTEDILKGVEAVNADRIYILPNNSNIILTANQVKEISDKAIEVIPTKNIPQGIAAIIAFDMGKDNEANVNDMVEAVNSVKVAEITYAARNTSIDDKEIHQGDIMGIVSGKISVVENEIDLAAQKVIDELIDEDSAVISVYYGSDISEEDVEKLKHYVETNYEDMDLDIHRGGQPLYYYIISVE